MSFGMAQAILKPKLPETTDQILRNKRGIEKIIFFSSMTHYLFFSVLEKETFKIILY